MFKRAICYCAKRDRRSKMHPSIKIMEAKAASQWWKPTSMLHQVLSEVKARMQGRLRWPDSNVATRHTGRQAVVTAGLQARRKRLRHIQACMKDENICAFFTEVVT